jgi:uncharacterized protein YoxC
MPFFVMVTALAVVLQAIMLIALLFQIRRTAASVEKTTRDLNARLTPILSRVETLVEDLSPRITGIVADASEISRLTRDQAQRVDRILGEALERLRVQVVRVDQIVTGTMEAVEEAGSRLRETVWGPMVKATAIVRGIQTGIEFFRAVGQGRVEVEVEPASDSRDEEVFAKRSKSAS